MLQSSPIENDSMENEELVARCIAGDRKYERKLFKKYRNPIYSLIFSILGQDSNIDDINQQVFIKIFRSLKNFKGLSSLKTWVYRITTKVCIDQLRKKYRKRQLHIISNTDYIDNHSDPSGTNPSKEQEQIELKKQIDDGLNKLSIDKRLVVTMFEMEGLSLQEISEILNKPVGTVKSRLFHGRKELAGHLRKYLDM
jgi:RNA polymerase sigma-70 factor (ECF subfamily)